jgi:hypothetical protein
LTDARRVWECERVTCRGCIGTVETLLLEQQSVPIQAPLISKTYRTAGQAGKVVCFGTTESKDATQSQRYWNAEPHIVSSFTSLVAKTTVDVEAPRRRKCRHSSDHKNISFYARAASMDPLSRAPGRSVLSSRSYSERTCATVGRPASPGDHPCLITMTGCGWQGTMPNE